MKIYGANVNEFQIHFFRVCLMQGRCINCNYNRFKILSLHIKMFALIKKKKKNLSFELQFNYFLKIINISAIVLTDIELQLSTSKSGVSVGCNERITIKFIRLCNYSFKFIIKRHTAKNKST